MTTQAGTVVGCIVYDREEFKTWVSDNLAKFLARGLLFNVTILFTRRFAKSSEISTLSPQSSLMTKRIIWSTSLPDFFSSMRNWGMKLSDVASYLRVFTWSQLTQAALIGEEKIVKKLLSASTILSLTARNAGKLFRCQ